ncbi:MAG: hypothetical protein PME_51840 [Priestia megaterium]
MIGKVLAGKAVVAKAVGGATIGTVIALGSMTSAFASDGQHITSTKASAHTEAATYTQAQAKTIALKNCGGTVQSVSFENNAYTFLIHGKDNQDHHVKVNAHSGKVVKVEKLSFSQSEAQAVAVKNCGGTVKSVGFNDGVYTFLIHGNDSRDHHVKVNAQSGKVIQIQSAAFTKAQVQSIALKNCSGTIQSSSYANDVYTFLIHGKDNKDHHVKINAETGKVIKVEAVKFTQEQAKQAALQQHKGTVQSVSFSEQAYTFVIKGTDNVQHTVKISPQTGKVC